MNLETIALTWRDEPLVIVAAPGPSLTVEVAEACRGYRTIAVQDAYRRMPWADVLYGCDAAWWRVHRGCVDFAGERWSSHDTGNNDKRDVAKEYGLRLVEGRPGETFSTERGNAEPCQCRDGFHDLRRRTDCRYQPAAVTYGGNSGFQAVNLAILRGACRPVLVGFDMHGAHFFGDHRKPLKNPRCFSAFIRAFNVAAKSMPAGVEIINATPGSALKAFPVMPVAQALRTQVAA